MRNTEDILTNRKRIRVKIKFYKNYKKYEVVVPVRARINLFNAFNEIVQHGGILYDSDVVNARHVVSEEFA
jgi:hypothetical protein